MCRGNENRQSTVAIENACYEALSVTCESILSALISSNIFSILPQTHVHVATITARSWNETGLHTLLLEVVHDDLSGEDQIVHDFHRLPVTSAQL